jgi:hypothetical protein
MLSKKVFFVAKTVPPSKTAKAPPILLLLQPVKKLDDTVSVTDLDSTKTAPPEPPELHLSNSLWVITTEVLKGCPNP